MCLALVLIFIAFNVFGSRAVDIMLPVDCSEDTYFPDMTSNMKQTGCSSSFIIKCSNRKQTIEICSNKSEIPAIICENSCGYQKCKKPFAFNLVQYKANSPYYGVCSDGQIIFQGKCKSQDGYTYEFDEGTSKCKQTNNCIGDHKIASNDCKDFIECINGIWVEHKCPSGFLYNNNRQICDPKYICPNSIIVSSTSLLTTTVSSIPPTHSSSSPTIQSSSLPTTHSSSLPTTHSSSLPTTAATPRIRVRTRLPYY